MTFTKRPLVAGATLGERLRTLREDARRSREEIGQQIHVAPKYLAAIEESRYNALPGLIYARQFVRRYAEALETDVEQAMNIFEQEYLVVTNVGPAKRPLITPRVNTEFPWYRRHLRLLVSGLVVGLVALYLAFQAVQNFLPPELTVTSPASDQSTKELRITVTGQTDPNATVTINDQDVPTQKGGQFTVEVDLHVGVNTLNIAAAKKHSSPRVVTRHVLVEQ